MNLNVVILFFSSSIFLISFILLFYFQYATIVTFLKKQIKQVVRKTKPINRELIAHHQQWKCAGCNSIMLSHFKITSHNYNHFAVCINCAPKYECIDKACLV